MAQARTPVWLVTGYLGAGKTTLLARWLAEPELAGAALVVNEVGEVGLDDALLARAVDSAALVANACVCCTGLPGLEQALADLWWGRLQRHRPAFDSVVIETTGLADPGPVIEAFHSEPFLRVRYVLAGVVVVVSATTAWPVLAAHPEALAQVRHADLLVLTKGDRADPGPMRAALSALRPGVPLALSAQASLGWAQARALIAPFARDRAAQQERAQALQEAEGGLAQPAGHQHLQGPGAHGTHSPHGAHARFLSCPPGLDREGLARWAAGQLGAGVQRLKGVLQSAEGRLYMAQWAPGDEQVALVGFDGPAPRLGLTCIA